MCLVPQAVTAVPQSRNASPHRPSLSKRKQVMLVTVIPIRIHPQHTIIIIFKQFTIITHIFITISIIIIFISVTISIQQITIICITQTHSRTSTIMRIRFLIVVFLQLQVLALVQTVVETWERMSHLISPSCRVKCRHRLRRA
jgi:hypothetical protein